MPIDPHPQRHPNFGCWLACSSTPLLLIVAAHHLRALLVLLACAARYGGCGELPRILVTRPRI
ncbi:MAG: hypothetical protein M3319_01530 [Actinomycetota bacterium]|nr:hypothetical protein [Actinomycetota bacterium]MDQ3899176.1 hypothetical protein [Actinomycetota bacterium]